MMQLLNRFIDLSQQAIEQHVEIDTIHNLPLLRRLRRMNEDIAEERLEEFEVLRADMEKAFAILTKKEASHAG
jgi:V/A-type H+-transporting ATPase subunit A